MTEPAAVSNRLITLLKRHEGFRASPYRDSVGKLTVGYGHCLDDRPLTEDQATYLLISDAEAIYAELRQRKPVVERIDAARAAALTNMAFNLGVPGLCAFRRMWAAIEAGDWHEAAAEALDSKWSKQVGARAIEVTDMLRTGQWPADLR